MLVERTRELTLDGATMDDALERVKRNAVFTIHTPVSAGNERFDAGPRAQAGRAAADGTGVDLERILELGRGADGDAGQFDMTAFSLRQTNGANAVSQLHAETANATWQGVSSGPILAITNGVHPPSWVGQPIRELYESLGGDLDNLDPQPKDRFWERLDRIPDDAALGGAPAPEAGARVLRPRPAAQTSSRATARRRRRSRRSRPRSTRRS